MYHASNVHLLARIRFPTDMTAKWLLFSVRPNVAMKMICFAELARAVGAFLFSSHAQGRTQKTLRLRLEVLFSFHCRRHLTDKVNTVREGMIRSSSSLKIQEACAENS